VFHADRWAGVFETVLGENAEAALACLKAMVPPVKAVSGVLSGLSAARQLETILRESADAAFGGNTYSTTSGNTSGNTSAGAIEYAIRFITLAVEKKQFKHIDMILSRIEERLDMRRGALTVTVESAVPVDGVFAEELRRQIMKRLGAGEVTMKIQLAPELLGGYRLRFGGFYIDASLKGQIGKMKADLEAVGS
jgi:hypothetical protein